MSKVLQNGVKNATGSTFDRIIQYEEGRMSEDEEVEFFQELLDTGMVFGLQGHYHRVMQRHIDAGNVKRKVA